MAGGTLKIRWHQFEAWLEGRKTLPVQDSGSSAKSSDSERLKDIILRCDAMATEKPRATFNAKNLEQDLPRLLKTGNVEQHRDVLDRQAAAAALAGEPRQKSRDLPARSASLFYQEEYKAACALHFLSTFVLH